MEWTEVREFGSVLLGSVNTLLFSFYLSVHYQRRLCTWMVGRFVHAILLGTESRLGVVHISSHRETHPTGGRGGGGKGERRAGLPGVSDAGISEN